MAEEIPAVKAPTDAERYSGMLAYNSAGTNAEKLEVIKKYPWLSPRMTFPEPVTQSEPTK